MSALLHPGVKFVDFTRIVANLVDEKLSARLELLLHLEELRHDFIFMQFEIGHHCTRIELRRGKMRGLLRVGLSNIEASIHFAKQSEQANRIDIEHGLTTSTHTCPRIVAGQHENIVKTLAREMPRLALKAITIKILTGQMNDHRAIRIPKRASQSRSRQHRITTRIIGDRHPIDLRTRREFMRKCYGLLCPRFFNRPTGGNQFRTDEKILRALELIR